MNPGGQYHTVTSAARNGKPPISLVPHQGKPILTASPIGIWATSIVLCQWKRSVKCFFGAEGTALVVLREESVLDSLIEDAGHLQIVGDQNRIGSGKG